MDFEQAVTVYRVNDPTKAQMICNALRTEGIECVSSGETQGGFAGVLAEVEILTHAADYDRALAIIREHESRMLENSAETDAEEENE